MKKLIILTIIILFVASVNNEAKTRYGSVSIGMFYSSLSSYGEWLELDAGLIVWRPNSVHAYWRPYSIGRWSWTNHGWYWDSYEPFGWATYHYGRWYYDDYYGWIWIPDNVWGPSWVEWRYDNDYIGWAPLPPYAQFRNGFGIYFSTKWNSHYRYWNFVTFSRFYSHRLNYYIIDNSRNYRIFSKTKYRNNYFMERDRIVNGGIDRSYVERKGGYKIGERNIYDLNDYEKYDRSRKSSGERIYNYRPSEREIENNREVEKLNITRGERKSSIETDRIVINERSSKEAEVRTDKISERTIERNNRTNEKIEKRETVREEPIRNQRTDERKIDSRSGETKKENRVDVTPRKEESRIMPDVSSRREVKRETESRNYRNETPQRSVEPSERKNESSKRKVEERSNDRSKERSSERRR
jgi:hypothetical protein